MLAKIDIADLAAPHEVVEQAIDLGVAAAFRKSIVPVALPGGGGLALVRKRSVRGATRGAVLLIHGYAQNRYAWHTSRRSVASYLAHDGFDVFNLDLRGAGRSREMGTPAPAGFADHVEGDLPAAIDAALRASGERRIFIVGHSLGGAIACAFAGRAPELVRGVVTISGLYAFGGSGRFMRLLGRAGAALAASGAASLLPRTLPTDLVGRALHLGRRGWDSRLAYLSPLQAWLPGSIEDEVLGEAIRRSFERASLGVTLGLARMAVGAGFEDGAGRCYFHDFEERSEVPLLVVTGCSDRLVSPEDARVAYERSRARDRTLRCFEAATDGGPGFGHIDMLLGRHAPARVWPYVRDWLRDR